MTQALKPTITAAMKDAMRAKDAERLGTIRLLLAAIKQKEVDERIELDDAAVVAVIDKLVKQRKDSVSAYTQANRLDLVQKEQAEIVILSAYLPQRLSAEEITEEVTKIIQNLTAELPAGTVLGSSDMGKVMGVVKVKLANVAEMALVSAAVKTALSVGKPAE